MPLTDLACKTTKPSTVPRKLSDGGGLYLLVQPNGSKLWRSNYRFAGKQKALAFGKYPLVGLAEARQKREREKGVLSPGANPAHESGEALPTTFEAVALEWLASR